MRGLALFASGILVGLLTQAVFAQDRGIRALSHVGIGVRNFDQAVSYYTKTLGFREAFALREPDGRPVLTYLQINRDTFIELQPTTGNQPEGVTHFGLEVGDLQETVRGLRQRGLQVEEPRMGRSAAPLANTLEPHPYGVRIELLEFAPASLQRKAIDGWK